MDDSTSTSTKISIETEFPADSSIPHTKANYHCYHGVTGAFEEMSLSQSSPSEKCSYDTAKEPTLPSDGSLSSRSTNRSTPSRPPPPRVHYSLPRARQDPPRDIGFIQKLQEVLMNERRDDEDDLDGVVYRSTTIGLRNSESAKVYDKVHEIRRQSSSTADFLRNFRIYVAGCRGPFFWISFYAVLALYPFAMIIIGSVNMKRCTIEPMIPVFMVVAGVFFIVKISFKIYEEGLEANKQHGIKQSLQAAIWWRIASAIISMFLFAWFIAGCVWVYRAHGHGVLHDVDKDDPLYCQRELFGFAFWTVTLLIILLGVLLVGTFLLMSCLIITSEQQQQKLEQRALR